MLANRNKKRKTHTMCAIKNYIIKNQLSWWKFIIHQLGKQQKMI